MKGKKINEAKRSAKITRYPSSPSFHPTLSSCLRWNVSQTNDRTEKFDFLPFPLFPRIKTFQPARAFGSRTLTFESLEKSCSFAFSPPRRKLRAACCSVTHPAHAPLFARVSTPVVRASWLSRQYSTRSQGEKRTLGFYSRKNEGKTGAKPF